MLELIFALLLYAAAADSQATDTGVLIVEVKALRNNSGYVVCHLFNGEDGYPTKSKKAMVLQDDYDIRDSTARFVFTDLPVGEYAFTTHHDENANHKMDKTWVGLPDEGWACSNNVRGILGMGPPSFDDAKFEVKSGETTKVVTMNY